MDETFISPAYDARALLPAHASPDPESHIVMTELNPEVSIQPKTPEDVQRRLQADLGSLRTQRQLFEEEAKAGKVIVLNYLTRDWTREEDQLTEAIDAMSVSEDKLPNYGLAREYLEGQAARLLFNVQQLGKASTDREIELDEAARRYHSASEALLLSLRAGDDKSHAEATALTEKYAPRQDYVAADEAVKARYAELEAQDTEQQLAAEHPEWVIGQSEDGEPIFTSVMVATGNSTINVVQEERNRLKHLVGHIPALIALRASNPNNPLTNEERYINLRFAEITSLEQAEAESRHMTTYRHSCQHDMVELDNLIDAITPPDERQSYIEHANARVQRIHRLYLDPTTALSPHEQFQYLYQGLAGRPDDMGRAILDTTNVLTDQISQLDQRLEEARQANQSEEISRLEAEKGRVTLLLLRNNALLGEFQNTYPLVAAAQFLNAQHDQLSPTVAKFLGYTNEDADTPSGDLPSSQLVLFETLLTQLHPEHGMVMQPQARELARTLLESVRESLLSADRVYISLGGAIGDEIMASGYARALRAATKALGHDVPMTFLVDESLGNLFAGLKSEPGDEYIVTTPGVNTAYMLRNNEPLNAYLTSGNERNVFHLSLYGSDLGVAPVFDKETISGKQVTTLRNVFNLGAASYSLSQGGINRFGNLVADLVGLPYAALPPEQTLPLIPLPDDHVETAKQLAQKYHMDPAKQRVAICIEGSEERKRWSLDNYAHTAALLEQSNPGGYEYDIFSLFKNYTPEEVVAAFAARGIEDKIRLVKENLINSAILLNDAALVLSNDTGLAHLAAATPNRPPVVVPFAPINKNRQLVPDKWVWGSIRAVVGPNDLGYFPSQIESQRPVNKIRPQQVYEAAAKALLERQKR